MNASFDPSFKSPPLARDFTSRSPGVDIAILRKHSDGGVTFLVRMRNGARSERHDHPGGEETYLLGGQLRVDRRVDASRRPLPDVVLSPGDYLYVPAGEVHEGIAEGEGTTLLVIAPGGVVVNSRP